MASEKVIKVPDLGGVGNVDVIEVLVSLGDKINKDDSLITLESDKASMEVPSPQDGVVVGIKLKVGDKVSEGDELVVLNIGPKVAAKPAAVPTINDKEAVIAGAVAQAETVETAAQPAKAQAGNTQPAGLAQAVESVVELPPVDTEGDVYAGPAVRRIANEFGVDLTKVSGTGQKGRVLKEDVQLFVKQSLQGQGRPGAGLSIAPAEAIDFSRFGEIEKQSLNKIKRLTGVNVHRSWVTVPHVTQFDQADITDLEVFRQSQKSVAEKEGIRLTVLAFIVKAVTKALQNYPQFNASLDADGQSLILKHYYHIGIAVDTPNGLVVPVIRDVDQKGVFEIAHVMADLSQRARKKQLKPQDMQGGCFTISSLGGIGGVAFTPIINAPEVAILGVSRASYQPVYKGDTFVPRLILPLALSYDHRVIDGAEAARFSSALADYIADVRKILL